MKQEAEEGRKVDQIDSKVLSEKQEGEEQHGQARSANEQCK